jgi:glycosyltransferase involved in cell wall biosynthesis
MGYVQDQKELAGIYSSADVFVNPTYADTFPTVNIESIACGTPVVTYQTGGSPEIIDEQTGYVARQGDYNDLVNGILQIANQSPSGKSLQRQRCRARAEALYNKDDRYAEYIELYNSLVK